MYSTSFALWNVLQGTDVKTFTMNVDIGLIQLVKSGGVLHVRSASDPSILETKANKISIPYNLVEQVQITERFGDLGIKVEYFNSEKLPENPPARDNLIFKHSEDYRNRLIEYLSSINHKNEFSTFKGALSVLLLGSGTTIIDEADVTIMILDFWVNKHIHQSLFYP